MERNITTGPKMGATQNIWLPHCTRRPRLAPESFFAPLRSFFNLAQEQAGQVLPSQFRPSLRSNRRAK